MMTYTCHKFIIKRQVIYNLTKENKTSFFDFKKECSISRNKIVR